MGGVLVNDSSSSLELSSFWSIRIESIFRMIASARGCLNAGGAFPDDGGVFCFLKPVTGELLEWSWFTNCMRCADFEGNVLARCRIAGEFVRFALPFLTAFVNSDSSSLSDEPGEVGRMG